MRPLPKRWTESEASAQMLGAQVEPIQPADSLMGFRVSVTTQASLIQHVGEKTLPGWKLIQDINHRLAFHLFIFVLKIGLMR